LLAWPLIYVARLLTKPTWHAQNCILSTEHTHNLLQQTWDAQKCIHSKDHTHNLLQIQRGMPKTVSSAQSTRTTSYKTNVGCPKMYPQQRSHAQTLTNPTWHAQNCILNTEHTHDFLQNQLGVPKNVSTAQSTRTTSYNKRGMLKTESTAQSTRTTSYKTNVACPKLYPQRKAHTQLLTTIVGCPKLYPQHRAHAQLLTKPTWGAQKCIHSTEHRAHTVSIAQSARTHTHTHMSHTYPAPLHLARPMPAVCAVLNSLPIPFLQL